MPIERAIVIAKMRKAFRIGQSASSFLTNMKAQGLSYRRTDMLADWRSVNEIESKKELLQYVRKDRLPSPKVLAKVTWDIKSEYMYVLKVKSQQAPDEPITERKVNIMQDTPLTPEEIERLGWEMISEQSPKEIAKVVSITAWSAVQRVD